MGLAVDMFGIGKLPKPIAILFSIATAFLVLGLSGWLMYDALNELYEVQPKHTRAG